MGESYERDGAYKKAGLKKLGDTQDVQTKTNTKDE